jgi:hypothetical protein
LIREELAAVIVNTVADGGLAKLKKSVVKRRSVNARASSNDDEGGGWDNNNNELARATAEG